MTEIYDTLQIRSKLETDQLSAVMKTLGNLVEKVSNDSELKGNPETQTAIGHYLAMVVNLIIVSSKVGKFLDWYPNQIDFWIMNWFLFLMGIFYKKDL